MVEAIPASSNEAPWIGIDLGTTFSAVGVWRNGTFETLQNKVDGKTTTASVVQFNPSKKGDIKVGDAAVFAQSRALQDTIYDAKRMIGMDFDDEKL